MNIEKYIEELTKLRQAHGPDVQVKRVSGSGFVTAAPLPRVQHTRLSARQSLFKEGLLPDKDKGPKVITV